MPSGPSSRSGRTKTTTDERVPIDRGSGKIVHVWNALCSDRHELIEPSSCPASDAAIWARAGAVVEPGTGRILVATGNAPYDGKTAWGDSVLELSPDAGELVGSWTPLAGMASSHARRRMDLSFVRSETTERAHKSSPTATRLSP